MLPLLHENFGIIGKHLDKFSLIKAKILQISCNMFRRGEGGLMKTGVNEDGGFSTWYTGC